MDTVLNKSSESHGSSSLESGPAFVASAPPSEVFPVCTGSVLSVASLAGESSASDPNGAPGAMDDALHEQPGDEQMDDLFKDDEVEEMEDDGAQNAPAYAAAPAALPTPAMPLTLRYGQNCPVPKHGRGGRKRGTGRRMKENFSRGLRRAIGAYLRETAPSTLTFAVDITADAAAGTLKVLKGWSMDTGREQVWLMPGMLGMIARWGEWRRDASGACASECVWLNQDGRGARAWGRTFTTTTTCTRGPQRASTLARSTP